MVVKSIKNNYDHPLITVITVCWNEADNIENTILSVLNQDYPNIEYIVIDGGSKDGTLEIIKKYSDRITYWVSEPDKGLYDAMNKGIIHSNGMWINILNSGDIFCSNNVLSEIFLENEINDIDVIYGNSYSIDNNGIIRHNKASTKVEDLRKYPIYRHGASFVLAKIHKHNLFDLSKKTILSYSLDYYMIYQLFKQGKKFLYKNIDIQTYRQDGLSANPLKNIKYNYLITHDLQLNTLQKIVLNIKVADYGIRNSNIYKKIKNIISNIIKIIK